MNLNSSKVESIFKRLQEISYLYKSKSTDFPRNVKFHIHNSHKGNWDEIWLLSREIDSRIKQPFMRVSLYGFSDVERVQLDNLVRRHNTRYFLIKELLTDTFLLLKSHLNKARLSIKTKTLKPLSVVSDES